MNNLKVLKMNDYEWYVTPWSVEKTVEWYNNDFDDELEEDMVEEMDLEKDGIFFLSDNEEDKNRLGDKDEIVNYIKKEDGKLKRQPKFGDLMRIDEDIYKFCSLKDVIAAVYKGEELLEPELIASTDF